MTKSKQSSELEQFERDAIEQILAKGGRMDYIDIVNAVRTRFRLDVSSDQVEQVILAHTLQFVKSVGGLANAKRALKELEATLVGGN